MNAPENRETVPGFPEIGRGSWIGSLRSQLRQATEERKHPAEKIELSAKQDPEALQKLIDMENPFMSVVAQVLAAVDEFRHPREKFEPTAQPIETDRSWSVAAHNPRVPGLLAVGVHLAMVGLLLVPLLFPPRQAIQVTETYVPLFTPVRLELPPMEELSGGGGGGGLETEEPPLLGEIPEAAEQQFVPPSVEPLPRQNAVDRNAAHDRRASTDRSRQDHRPRDVGRPGRYSRTPVGRPRHRWRHRYRTRHGYR